MSSIAILTKQVALLTEALTAVTQNAKKIDELPDQLVLNPNSVLHASLNGVSQKLSLQKIISDILNFKYNRLISVAGSITVSGNNITIPAAVWVMENINYQTYVATVLNTPYAAVGYTRIDIIVGNKSNQIVRIAGPETVGVNPAPNTPIDTVLITTVVVTDSTIADPALPIIDADYEFISNKNQPDGYAGLDSTGRVASAQLPSYVDDILEGYLQSNVFYVESSHTTVIPAETGKVYVDITTGQKNKQYRYSGSTYIQITNGLIASTDDVLEGTTNLYYTSARSVLKQDTLVSGTNIKTLNGVSLLGSGNLSIVASVTETLKTISSADLNTQDVSGFLSYINSVASFSIAQNEIVKYLVSDTGQIFEILVNNRMVGSGQTALSSNQVLELRKPYVKWDESMPAHDYWLSNGNSGWNGRGILIGIIDGTIGYTSTGSNFALKRRLANKITSAATAGSSSQIRTGVPIGNLGTCNFLYECFMAYEGSVLNSTLRSFTGFRITTGNNSGIGSIDPSTQTNVVGLGNDSSDSNMQIMHNDGSGVCTKIDLGNSFPSKYLINEHSYRCLIHVRLGTNETFVFVEDMITGSKASRLLTTNLPATASPIYPISWMNNGSTAQAVDMTSFGWQIKNN